MKICNHCFLDKVTPKQVTGIPTYNMVNGLHSLEASQSPPAKIWQLHRNFSSFSFVCLYTPTEDVNNTPPTTTIHFCEIQRINTESLESNFGLNILDPKASIKRELFYFKASITKKLKSQSWKIFLQ